MSAREFRYTGGRVSMSGPMVSCGTISKFWAVRDKLKELDTLLYEIARDYRVSGLPNENNDVSDTCFILLGWIDRIRESVISIKRESEKSPITGKEK